MVEQKRARSQAAIQKRYDDILERTTQLFLEHDYNDITLALVAKELKISRPSLYNYFPSKEELFLALLKREYLLAEENFRTSFGENYTTEEFCKNYIEVFFKEPLFIKLLSLHSTVLEEKSGYEVMKQFKTDTMPFFRTQFDIIRRQFPGAKEEYCWQFLQQVTTISQTFYQYNHIPEKQIRVMAELGTFGNAPLLTAEDYFTRMLLDFARHLE